MSARSSWHHAVRRGGVRRRSVIAAVLATAVVALALAPGLTASAAPAPAAAAQAVAQAAAPAPSAAGYQLGIMACVDGNYIGAVGWPAGAEVDIAFDNDTNPSNGVLGTDRLTCDATGFAWYQGPFDIQSGQHIRASAAGGYAAALYVDPVYAIAGASGAADKVWGTGVAGVAYDCFTHDQLTHIQGTVDAGGTWIADFTARGLATGDAGGVAFMIGSHQLYRQWSATEGGQPPVPGNGDTVAPVTTLANPPTSWSKTDVPLTLTAEDNQGGSGVAHTYFKLGSGGVQTYPPCVVTAEGETLLHYWSVDASGNVEPEKHADIWIDRSGPTCSYTGTTMLAPGAPVSLTATDELSHLDYIKYAVDGSADTTYNAPFTLPNGQHSVRFFGVDNAGNVGQPMTVVLNVGTQPAPPVTLPATTTVQATTTITIRSSQGSVVRNRSFVLTGLLTPGMVGDPVVVYVKKPGKAYWTYSSKRLAYRMTATQTVEYWYRYTPRGRTSPRGLYAFKAAFVGDEARLGCVSPVITVRVR